MELQVDQALLFRLRPLQEELVELLEEVLRQE
jgi:hypothetical protein